MTVQREQLETDVLIVRAQALGGKRILILIATGVLCCSLPSPAASQEPARKAAANPRFEDYAVNQPSERKPGRICWPSGIDPKDPANRNFIDSVEEGVAHGPNFAGHYSIAHWGLGTGISSIAVVDLNTGKIFRRTPFYFLDVAWDPDRKLPYRGFSFRANSKLLVASGCFYIGESQSGNDCGWKYYKWEQNRFVLLNAIPGPVPRNYGSQKKREK